MKKLFFIAIIMACLGMNLSAQKDNLGSISWVEHKGFLLNGTCSTHIIDDGTTIEQCGQIAKLLMRSNVADTKLFKESLTHMDSLEKDVKAFKQWGQSLMILSESPAKISRKEFSQFEMTSEKYFDVKMFRTLGIEIWQIRCSLFLFDEQPIDEEKIVITTINICQCAAND
jgi:hypothetical protein